MTPEHGVEPVRLIVAILARSDAWRERAEGLLAERLGPPDRRLPSFDFTETSYYDDEMGMGLRKGLIAFPGRYDPQGLWRSKTWCCRLEEALAAEAGAPGRPANLDPGWVDGHRVVLFTTKDRPHRLPLGGGIFGEVTLSWHCGAFQPAGDWTYMDFRRGEMRDFLVGCRAAWKEERRAGGPVRCFDDG